MKTKKLITGIIAAVSGLLLSGCLTTEIETVHSQVHHYEYNRCFEKIYTCTTKAFRTNNDSVINVYFWWPDKTNEKYVFTYKGAGKMQCLELSDKWCSEGEKLSKVAYRNKCYDFWKNDCENTSYDANYGIITYYGTIDYTNAGEENPRL